MGKYTGPPLAIFHTNTHPAPAFMADFTLKLPQEVLDIMETLSDADLLILAGIPNIDQQPAINILRRRGVMPTPVDSERPPTDEETRLIDIRQAEEKYITVRKLYTKLHKKLLDIHRDLGEWNIEWESDVLQEQRVLFEPISRHLELGDKLEELLGRICCYKEYITTGATDCAIS